jgi:hypothetical protein
MCSTFTDWIRPLSLRRFPLVPLKSLIQRLTAGILKYEGCPPFVASERERPKCPRWIEFGCERILVLETLEILSRRLFYGEGERQNQ